MSLFSPCDNVQKETFEQDCYVNTEPFGPKCQEFNGCVVDKDAALMARVFGMEEDIHLISPVVLGRGSTKRFLDGHLTTAELEDRLISACREMERKYDFRVIEGTGHGGVGSVVGLSDGAT